MGGQPIDGVNRQAEQIAMMLDSGDPASATEALRQASFQYEPEDFNRLVTAVEYMEQPKTGADLIIEPVNEDFAYDFASRSHGQFQNQSAYRGGVNGRYNVSETVASIVGPDGDGSMLQADVALLRTRVDHLSAVRYPDSASNVSGRLEPNQSILQDGRTIADMLDNGGVPNALEGLRQKSFGNSSDFARTLFAVDNFEAKQSGSGDLQLTAVDTGENYFSRRDRQYGQFQNRGRWDGRHDRYENRYPINRSLVSVVAQNPESTGAQNQFYRADIAVGSTSVAPMDATPRRR